MTSVSYEHRRKEALHQRLLVFSFCNLLVVALLGLLLRSIPFLSSFPLTYEHVLHGHSHFAFGGWVMPVLLALTMRSFPLLSEKIKYSHWRNSSFLVLLSAYGMLLSFPVQGYAAVSISFSTLSIVATVYWAIVVWKAAPQLPQTTSLLFLKWALLYGCLSAIGPFATGPLMALGKAGKPIYFDAIYFYLHFQYNGFFTFTVLALLYRLMEQRGFQGGQIAFRLLNIACLPAYALSVVWSEPGWGFNVVGGAAAVLQVAAVFYLLKDVIRTKLLSESALLLLPLSAFLLKNLLQFLSAFPFFAQMAFHNRNLVIAYLHLVMLGFVSLFVFGMALKENRTGRLGYRLFLFSFVTTECMLVLQTFLANAGHGLSYYAQLLLGASLFFPLGVAFMIVSLWSKSRFMLSTIRRQHDETHVPALNGIFILLTRLGILCREKEPSETS